MAIKVGFVSLGCPKNQLDIEVMLSHLLDAGYEITPEETEADIVIINTCAFIESAKKESIDNILDIAWLKEHGNLKGIVVTGCLAERYRDEVINEMPEVDAVLGVGSIHSIAKAVESVAKGEKFSEFENKNTVALGGDRIVTTGDTMAYLKISEGCDNCCTYCAIPKIIGRFRSRPMDDLIKEAAELADMGIKEIVVIGQDTTAYGIDLYGEYKLPTLLSRIANETDVAWIRILYCYPDKITDELINEFKTNPKLVKYIDLPIQHISGNVLKRMNRKGNEKAVRDAIKRLREGVPGIAIRTTAIVGFPGETEEDFLELCEFIKEAKFEHFGAFTYSREENTPAYDFKDQIDEDEKERRYDIIMREQFNIHEQMAQKKIGTECVVLVESFDPVAEVYVSRRSDNAPEIDGKVFIKARKGTLGIGEFINVRIDDAIDDYDFIASVC
ncbi:MAG: 30S ribosomal protein S12 methylthiotransferase RimO [Clostridia bacterium]|nr:30S ribosomal protein S12 methylthiotransferase RimO [Clostridia bacterium]